MGGDAIRTLFLPMGDVPMYDALQRIFEDAVDGPSKLHPGKARRESPNGNLLHPFPKSRDHPQHSRDPPREAPVFENAFEILLHNKIGAGIQSATRPEG